MKRISYTTLILLAALLFCVGQLQAAEQKETTSDTWLEAQLITSYTLNKHLNPFEIDVEVVDGVATISGTVDSEIERDLAVEIAKGIKGIKEVNEELLVEPDRQEKQEKSEFAQNVEDATTTAKVKYRLLFNKHISPFDINVDTDNGIVSLNGTVDSSEKRDLAVKLAENTSGVKSVQDNLRVGDAKEMQEEEGGSSAQGTMKRWSTNINDAWITAKAESLLLISDEAEGARYDIRTENGTVIVTGTVLSEKQAKDIQQVLADLQGVKNVENKLVVR